MLWIDKGNAIRPQTLRSVKQHSPATVIAGYSPDDMFQRHNNSRYFVEGLPLYDCYFTTKSYGVKELESIGCRRVFFVDNAFDPALHRPVELTAAERERIGGPVGFLGFFEEKRRRASECCWKLAFRCECMAGNGKSGCHPTHCCKWPVQYSATITQRQFCASTSFSASCGL